MCCAVGQQRQLINYPVAAFSDEFKLRGKFSVCSDYGRYTGVDEFSQTNIMDIISKKLHSSGKPESRKVEKESELIGLLSKQLYLAGSQMQRMQVVLRKAEERLKSKDQEIGRLKRKVREWEVKSRNQESLHRRELQRRQSQLDNSDFVYNRCTKLESKILEMEKFLADYGLVWVGERAPKSPKSPELSNDFIQRIYPQLTANIEELNLSVGKDEMHVCHSQGGATFKTASCMNLKFYKNGMTVQRGRLRPYSDPATRSFIQDILDGYFPAELQRDYPSGVPFKVEDHRMEMHLSDGGGYPGHGYQLGKISRICPKVVGRASTPKTPKQRINSNTSVSRVFSARPSHVKSSTGTPKVPSSARLESDLSDLRSQILASHNNNCSDSHLQSHLNAELALTSRSEKKSPRVSSTECHLPVAEFQPANLKLPQAPKSHRFNSADRSSFGVPSRSDTRSRRSASLSGNRFPRRPISRLSTAETNSRAKTSRLRASKSATEKPKNELPTLREVNLPTGDADELQLKVRSMNGSTVYLVHVSADDAVSRLYQLLDRVVPPRKQRRSYKIVVSGYSPKRLDHLGVSLRDYGICRNCVLHLVND